MGKTNTNLQDPMLNKIRSEQVPVSIYLTNGVQLRGVIKGFDNFIVMLEGEGRQMMIYKHAITTIAPVRHVGFPIMDKNQDKTEGDA
jgi:host factor-I protein